VLRGDGRLLLTTPNRLTFSPGLDEPINPFHVKEFDADELVALVERCGFAVEDVLGLHAGARLGELDERHGGSFVQAQLAAPPEKWSETLRADVEGVTADDFPIVPAADTDVDASLDLLVVARPDPRRAA
jgi:hypothetical protein